MSVTLVVGGARSGKSRYAESLLRSHPKVTYVAQDPCLTVLILNGQNASRCIRLAGLRSGPPSRQPTSPR